MPLYAQVKRALSELIERKFQDGQPFYSEKTLAARLPVSLITIRRALNDLSSAGLLERAPGRGTTVRKRRTTPGGLVRRPSSGPDAKAAHGDALADAGAAVKTVGIFRPARMQFTSEYCIALMDRFQSHCEARGMETRFYDSASYERIARTFAQIASPPEQEAFVLHTPSDTTLLLYHALTHRGYNVVAMEGITPDFPGAIVATDAAAAVRIGMEHLTRLGHRRIVLLVNEPAREFNVRDKIAAFQDHAQATGLAETCHVVACDRVTCDDSHSAAYTWMPQAMRHQPTAIFTVSDPGAWAALQWLAQNGHRVPDDVSVLGFEDARSSKYMVPALSSVAHPIQQLVETTVSVLWNADPESGPCKILVPPVLIARDSTGPVSDRSQEKP